MYSTHNPVCTQWVIQVPSSPVPVLPTPASGGLNSLITTLSCLKSLFLFTLYTNLSHLTTDLYVLFCVFPVCYDVRLSHLNKPYLLIVHYRTLTSP